MIENSDAKWTYHWGPTIYCSKQTKRKLKAKVKMLQEKRIAYEAIKI
jgi:hypothetical protein